MVDDGVSDTTTKEEESAWVSPESTRESGEIIVDTDHLLLDSSVSGVEEHDDLAWLMEVMDALASWTHAADGLSLGSHLGLWHEDLVCGGGLSHGKVGVGKLSLELGDLLLLGELGSEGSNFGILGGEVSVMVSRWLVSSTTGGWDWVTARLPVGELNLELGVGKHESLGLAVETSPASESVWEDNLTSSIVGLLEESVEVGDRDR